MNSCIFSGKIFKLEDKTESGKNALAKVQLRLGLRKPYVSDQDKKDGKTLMFMSMDAIGQTADFIMQYFKKDDSIEVVAQYSPFENKDGDEIPWFKIREASFPAGGNGGGDKKDDDDKPARRRRNRDDEDEKPARGSRRSRRDEDEDEDDAPPRRRRRASDDGDSPF